MNGAARPVGVCLVGLAAAGFSGVARYAAALATALDAVAPEFADLRLRLVTTDRGARRVGARTIAVDVARPPFRHAHTGPRRIAGEQLEARLAREELLHFFDLTGPLLAPRRRFVTTVHDAAPSHAFDGARSAHKRRLHPWAVRRASAAVAVSEFARAEAVGRLGADPAKVRVIHSGPGLVRGEAAAADDGDREPLLLYVGNLAAHKNLLFLIRAFAGAALDARLVIVGVRGELWDEVRAAAGGSGAADRIELRRGASDEELLHLYDRAAALLLPSRYEGFGFTALEAMARGCPVLASDIPALREVSGEGAELLPLDDETAWAEAMRRVLADGAFARGLRERGARRVARYSWERTARELCALFAELGRAGGAA